MAPDHRVRVAAPPLAALALAAALSACGGTLYDAAGVPVVTTSGPPCIAPSHVCGGQCVAQSPAACGSGCSACAGATGATATCDEVSAGTFSCGYTCPEGQLACPSGCCHPTAVAAGAAHACAVTDAQSLVCWGLNDRGQVGPAGGGAAVPRPVQVFPDGVTAVSAGAHHTCAVRAGAVTCWGANDGGQLGTGSAGSGGPTPVAAGLSGVAALALGTAHSCALTSGGTIRCWGANASGQLGAGDTAPRVGQKSTPVGSGASLLAGGGDTSCAVAGGGPICWGADARGQSGAGPGGATRPPRSTPGAVAGVPAGTPVSLAVGGLHACASYGGAIGLWCWGADDAAQLGAGAIGPDALSAIQASKVDNKARSVAVAAGGGHTCSAKDAVELTCAGRNDQQQGGAPSPDPLLEGPPISLGGNLVVAGGPASAWAAGGDFTCALVDVAGAVGVKCWGGNGSGQLGRGTAGGAAAVAEYVSSKR